MPFHLEDKLVVAVASSALFDLRDSHKVFLEQGPIAYRDYQEKNIDNTLKPGVAFPFVKRLLNLNNSFEEQPIEVILLSRNSPETGLRVFRSIKSHNLNISRASFFSGESPYKYIPAFDTALFLSANQEDVNKAIKEGLPAGQVLDVEIEDDPNDEELRIAFDFDGVIIDDESETVFKKGSLSQFHDNETTKSELPHKGGPLKNFIDKIGRIQAIENRRLEIDKNYKKVINTAIVTARNAPSHERFVTTLKDWGITVDTTFFLGGIEKSRVLKIMKPHIYFDDQKLHLDVTIKGIPFVHIPFGIANE